MFQRLGIVGRAVTAAGKLNPLTDGPAKLRRSTLNFAVGGGAWTTNTSFSGSKAQFGQNSLLDIQTRRR